MHVTYYSIIPVVIHSVIPLYSPQLRTKHEKNLKRQSNIARVVYLCQWRRQENFPAGDK